MGPALFRSCHFASAVVGIRSGVRPRAEPSASLVRCWVLPRRHSQAQMKGRWLVTTSMMGRPLMLASEPGDRGWLTCPGSHAPGQPLALGRPI